MPMTLKNLSLNSRLDKLEDELRVMLLFSSRGKDNCQDAGHISCDCFDAEQPSKQSQDCKCIEAPKQVDEPKMSAKNLRSRSAPEKRRKHRHSSDSRDQGSPKKELDKIMQIFQRNQEKEKKKKRHCICESSDSDCCKESKRNKENLKPIDIRTPPRKSRTKKKHREKETLKKLQSSSQTDAVSLELPNKSIHPGLCCCPSRPTCCCNSSKGVIPQLSPKRTTDLKIEVNALRKEIEDISNSKLEADILKQKYGELQCCKMQIELELQHLRKENQQLAGNLDAEKNIRTEKIEAVQSNAKILVDRIRSEEDKLVKDLESKNDLIRRLSKATDDLTKTIQDKEIENCAMNCKIKQIETTTKLATQKMTLLKDTNRQLAKSVLNKHQSLQNCQKKTCKYKREVKEYKARVEQSLQQEIQRFRDKTYICECSKKSAGTKVFCQEAEDSNTVKELVNKIGSLENIQLQNIAKMAKKNKVLQSGFENLYQLMTCGDSARKNTCCTCKELKEKCQEIREKSQELKEEIKCLKRKEKQRASECEELKLLIEELTLLIKKQKERLQEFLELNDKQAQMLVAQEAVIASHNEQVTLIEMENQIIKKKCNDLEKDSKERKDKNMCSPLKKQLEQFRLRAAEDQDSLKINEKIIEDQANTIIDLKKKVQANSGLTMNIMNQGLSQQQDLKRAKQESDEKIRRIEYENSVLRADLQQMHASKTKLQAQIAAIDTHLIRDYRAQADQLEHQKQTIADLRHEVELQAEEHELQMEVLMKDMNSAKMTARYATLKLEETLRDFQKQTNSQMEVRDVLTGMLKEKDCKLKSAIVKMSSLTFDPTSIASAISRQQPPVHMHELNQFMNTSSDPIEPFTTHIAEEQHTSDFQQQLRFLVPSELYSNVGRGTKNIRATKGDDDGRHNQVEIENEDNARACYKTSGCCPSEGLYCSETSGTSTSGGMANDREEKYKKGSQNIYISPYIEDDEPTYIYIPKFRPASRISSFETSLTCVKKEGNEVADYNANNIRLEETVCYCPTNQSKNMSVDYYQK